MQVVREIFLVPAYLMARCWFQEG